MEVFLRLFCKYIKQMEDVFSQMKQIRSRDGRNYILDWRKIREDIISGGRNIFSNSRSVYSKVERNIS